MDVSGCTHVCLSESHQPTLLGICKVSQVNRLPIRAPLFQAGFVSLPRLQSSNEPNVLSSTPFNGNVVRLNIVKTTCSGMCVGATMEYKFCIFLISILLLIVFFFDSASVAASSGSFQIVLLAVRQHAQLYWYVLTREHTKVTNRTLSSARKKPTTDFPKVQCLFTGTDPLTSCTANQVRGHEWGSNMLNLLGM